MTLELEIPERMSQLMADQLRDSEFKSPEALALAAIAEYLEDKAEQAHIQKLLHEGEASGPYIEMTLEELKADLHNMFLEAKADLVRKGIPIRD